MKKKILIVLMFVVVLSLKEVYATQYSAYLPGGKNYLDVENMIINSDLILSDDNMLVKPNTEYTLTIPGFDLIGNGVFIEMVGEEDYIYGDPQSESNCDVDPFEIICTFTTTTDESSVNFLVESDMMSMYYDYYGFETFQLEEGSTSTSYEPYIAPFIDTTTPEFSGVGAYIKSYQTNETIASIIDNHVVAIDDIDGDISHLIVIISDEYTSNEQIVGDYDVLLSVSDSSGNEALFTLTVMVKDEIPPVITGPEEVTISVDYTASVESIITENFVIIDEYDSTLDVIIDTDNYSSNMDVLGEYLVVFSITDSSQNIANESFIIDIVDNANPVMVGSSVYNSYLSNPMNTTDILESIDFTDNYDDLTGVFPTVISDSLISNETTPGTYYINIEMSDNSNNVLSETLSINVIDDISPTLSGPVSYSGSYESSLLLSDFIDMLSVSDNVDSLSNNDIYVISDTYTNRLTEIGNYIIIFGVVDSNNNETTHQMDITVFDDIAPVIYVDNYIVTVNLSSTFNEEDALKLLLNSNELLYGNYTIIKLLDEYTGNETTPGSYIYRLSFISDNGDTFEKEFLVKVTDSNTFNIEQDLLPRNIAIYTSIFGYFAFILFKKKRLGI